MRVPFASREELLARGFRRDSVDEMYDLWQAAHSEAMALAERLPEVFGDPPRPRITLHVARGIDDEWRLAEARFHELSAMDSEQHWSDVTAAAAQEFQEYFTFADAEGWRFYLPAFLRHYLAGFPLYRYEAVMWACCEKAHFDLFDKQQTAFVDEFLALVWQWED